MRWKGAGQKVPGQLTVSGLGIAMLFTLCLQVKRTRCLGMLMALGLVNQWWPAPIQRQQETLVSNQDSFLGLTVFCSLTHVPDIYQAPCTQKTAQQTRYRKHRVPRMQKRPSWANRTDTVMPSPALR